MNGVRVCVNNGDDPQEECRCLITEDSGPDFDDDQVLDICDNCRKVYNSDQNDTDDDGIGDICDNYKNVTNADQKDYDLDKLGDVCDPSPRDVRPYVLEQEVNGNRKPIVAEIMEKLLELYFSKW